MAAWTPPDHQEFYDEYVRQGGKAMSTREALKKKRRELEKSERVRRSQKREIAGLNEKLERIREAFYQQNYIRMAALLHTKRNKHTPEWVKECEDAQSKEQETQEVT